MPCFNGIKKRITCLMGSEDGIGTSPMIRRRFGVSSSGTIISRDIYGEPVDSEIDVYNDLTIYGIVERINQINDEESNIGGRPSTKRSILDFVTSTVTDVLLNDLVEFPVDSNQWFRVSLKEPISGNYGLHIVGYHEQRSER